MRLELIFAESAFNKTCLYRSVRTPITKTRPNNTRQRAISLRRVQHLPLKAKC